VLFVFLNKLIDWLIDLCYIATVHWYLMLLPFIFSFSFIFIINFTFFFFYLYMYNSFF